MLYMKVTYCKRQTMKKNLPALKAKEQLMPIMPLRELCALNKTLRMLNKRKETQRNVSVAVKIEFSFSPSASRLIKVNGSEAIKTRITDIATKIAGTLNTLCVGIAIDPLVETTTQPIKATILLASTRKDGYSVSTKTNNEVIQKIRGIILESFSELEPLFMERIQKHNKIAQVIQHIYDELNAVITQVNKTGRIDMLRLKKLLHYVEAHYAPIIEFS